MCGIVGLLLKNPAMENQLGSMLERMPGTMCERGPDFVDFAVYGSGIDQAKVWEPDPATVYFGQR